MTDFNFKQSRGVLLRKIAEHLFKIFLLLQRSLNHLEFPHHQLEHVEFPVKNAQQVIFQASRQAEIDDLDGMRLPVAVDSPDPLFAS